MGKKKKYYVAAMTKLNFRKSLDSRVGETYVDNNQFVDKVNNQGEYTGFLTNEVPTYCMLDMVLNEGQIFDKFVFFITPECKNERGFVVNGDKKIEMNTVEYFEHKIYEYLSTKLDLDKNSIESIISKKTSNKNGDLIKNYIDEYISPNYIELPDDMNNDDLYHCIMGLMDKGEDFSDVEIYYDITGGLRLPQFVSMVLIRAMENLNASVKKVVYADFTKTPKRIIDCTSNYKITSIYKSSNASELNETLKKLGITEKGMSKEELERTEEFVEKIHSNSLIASNEEKKKTVEHKKLIEEKTKQSNGLVAQSQKKVINDAKKSVEEDNPFIKMSNLQDEKIITSFNEELIKAFYCIGFLDLTNGNKNGLTRSVKYSFEYYLMGFEFKQGNEMRIKLHSVIKEIKSLLEELKNNIDLSGVDLLNERLKLDSDYYSSYYDPYPDSLTEKKIKSLLEKYPEAINELDPISCFKREILYADYGFPFYYDEKYNYRNNDQWPIKYYRRVVKRLLTDIDKEWEAKKYEDVEGYKKAVDERISNLIEYIPYKYETDYWKFDKDIEQIINSGGSIEEFLKGVLNRLEIVRPYRNDLAHKLGKYSIEDRKKLVEESIKPWLHEYAEFASDYMEKKNKKPRSLEENKGGYKKTKKNKNKNSYIG